MKPTDTSIIEVASIELTPTEGTTKARGVARLPDGAYVDIEIKQKFGQASEMEISTNCPRHLERIVRLRMFQAWYDLVETPLIAQADGMAQKGSEAA